MVKGEDDHHQLMAPLSVINSRKFLFFWTQQILEYKRILRIDNPKSAIQMRSIRSGPNNREVFDVLVIWVWDRSASARAINTLIWGYAILEGVIMTHEAHILHMSRVIEQHFTLWYSRNSCWKFVDEPSNSLRVAVPIKPSPVTCFEVCSVSCQFSLLIAVIWPS